MLVKMVHRPRYRPFSVELRSIKESPRKTVDSVFCDSPEQQEYSFEHFCPTSCKYNTDIFSADPSGEYLALYPLNAPPR